MLSRPAVALFALAVIEYVAVTRLAAAIGGGVALLVLLGLSVLGWMLFRRVGSSFVEASVATAMKSAGVNASNLGSVPGADRFADADGSPDLAADRAMMLFGALLLLIPGIASGALGALFFFPPVRALARPVVLHRIQPWIRPNLRFGRGTMGFGRDVVDVDIVDHTDEPQQPRPELS